LLNEDFVEVLVFLLYWPMLGEVMAEVLVFILYWLLSSYKFL
jgi:hypothetical protein